MAKLRFNKNLLLSLVLGALATVLLARSEAAFAAKTRIGEVKFILKGTVNLGQVIPMDQAYKKTTDYVTHNDQASYFIKATINKIDIVLDEANLLSKQRPLELCLSHDISVGSRYLFLVSNLRSKDNCLSAVAFLLGSAPGQEKYSSIVLTEDVLRFIPKKATLSQSVITIPYAIFEQNNCNNGVVTGTYMNLQKFLDFILFDEKNKKP